MVGAQGIAPPLLSPGQMCLPWDSWEVDDTEITAVAEKFVFANCYNPQVAGAQFKNYSS